MGLAKSDTRNTAGDEAKVDRVEAVKQVRGPTDSAGWGSRVDVLARTRQHIVESILPVVHISIADGTTSSSRRRRLHGGLSRGRGSIRSDSRSLVGSSHIDDDDGFWVSKRVCKRSE